MSERWRGFQADRDNLDRHTAGNGEGQFCASGRHQWEATYTTIIARIEYRPWYGPRFVQVRICNYCGYRVTHVRRARLL